MLWVHDKLYTFYDHFQEQIERRRIRIDWVEQAMLEPDRIGFSKTTGRYLYDKYIPNADISVRAVVDEEQNMIVTAHYLRERPEKE